MSDVTKDRVEGTIDKAKGEAKDTAGKITGDDKLREEGMLDKAEGMVKEGMADAKEAVDGLVKKVKGDS